MDATLAPQHLNAAAAALWTWAVDFLPRIATAVLIVVIGAIVAGWLSRIAGRILARAGHVDPTIRPVVAATVRYAVLILVLVAALGQVGVQTASLLAVLGAAGLAIGLALQGTLTNIAAGIMLLWLRPFRIGDYIEVSNGQALSGIIKEMGLFACIMQTYDGLTIFAPNSTIWNFALKNHNRNAGRLVAYSVTLPPAADIARAREVLSGLVQKDEGVLNDPAPGVFVDAIGPSGLVLNCRLWASHDRVGEVQRTVLERVKTALDATGEDALRPISITRTVPPDNDPSRLIVRGAVPQVPPGSFS